MNANELITASVGAVAFMGAMAWTVKRELNRSKRNLLIQTGEPAAKKKVDKKAQKTKPIQEFLPVDRVEPNGELVLSFGGFRRLINIGNVNPFALSDAEARSIRDHFKTMFSMFKQPIQFIVRGRRMDLTDYRSFFSDTYKKTADKWENDRLLEYGRHIEAHLVDQGNRQRTIRENLFVTEADGGVFGPGDVEELRRVLYQETDTALSSLSRCRVTPQLMSSEEEIEALQIFWNRDRLHARARDAVEEGSVREYYVGDEEVKWSVR